MKTTSLLSLASVALALAGASVARADTIDVGTYTIDYTKTGDMILIGSGSSVQFGHGRVDGVTTSPDYNVVSESGQLTAVFQAAPGKIFDRVSFGGMSNGLVADRGDGGAWAWLDWQVHGGTFVEGASSGGSAEPGFRFARQWEITDHTTGDGSSFFLWNAYGTIFYDNSNNPAGSGYYSIGAESFSMDISALVEVYTAAGNPWPPTIDPQRLNFSFTFLDAPPPSPADVPEGASTAGLMVLALAGLVGVRRMTKSIGESV